MNEHDELEPTAAMPRVDAPPRNVTPPAPLAEAPAPSTDAPPRHPVAMPPPAPGPLPPVAPPPPAYAFGNPFAYVIRRFLAFALDVVLVTAVATMLLYGFIAINPLTGLPSNSERGFDTTFALGLAIALLYLWVFEAMAGTTLGKLAFSLHVFAPRGRVVGLGRAFIRNLLRPIDALVIGWILALLPGHRRLGDLFAGTVVARSPLRAFAPLVGWVLIIALAGLPFVVAGGVVTVFAVGAAFVEFIPHLVVRAFDFVLQLFGGAPHPAAPTTAS
ncbi:MAG: RDD family protein [Candidatus Velthaea sp.]